MANLLVITLLIVFASVTLSTSDELGHGTEVDWEQIAQDAETEVDWDRVMQNEEEDDLDQSMEEEDARKKTKDGSY